MIPFALAATASADGIVVPQRAIVKPARTPDQRALLRFDGTTETLVIETTVEGEGREFAWVLPLPAAPKVEASTTGLFPTLESMCAPEVLDEPEDGKRARRDPEWFFFALLGVSVWAAIRWWRRPLHPAAALALALAPGFVASVMWVGCGATTKMAASPGASGVTVLSHQKAGLFDTVTLDARDPAALRSWLDANGFRAPDGIDAVVADYLKEGWVFVASKVRRDADDDAVRRIHPLAFTFPSKVAVYPMRLTGAGNESMALGLFVVGDRRAEVPGMSVEFCDDDLVSYLDPAERAQPADLSFSYRESRGELWRRCAGTKVLTKLAGVLDRAAMATDLEVTWRTYSQKRITYLTEAAAKQHALVAGALGFAGVFVATAVLGRIRRRTSGRATLARDLWSAVVALLTGAFIGAVDRHAADLVPAGAILREDYGGGGAAGLLGTPPASVRGDVGALRAWARSVVGDRINPQSGEPVREEDSPGNWLVSEEDGRIELIVYRDWDTEYAVDVSTLASLEGTVRAADGTIVAGAHVRLTSTEHTPLPGEFFTYTTTTDTDATGRYRLDVPAGRNWHVSVVHDDHPYLLRLDVDLRNRAAQLIDLTLPRERTLYGRAIDGSGRPVPWARVELARESPFSTHGNASQATTKFDGRFEFKGLDADAAEVRVLLRIEPWEWSEAKVFKLHPGDGPVELRLTGK